MESIKEFNTDIFKLFDDHWALVTAARQRITTR